MSFGARLLIALAVVGAGIWIMVKTSDTSPGSGSSYKAPDDRFSQTGCSASRRAITARLKAPSSAKFGDCTSTTSGGVQTVTWTVDSQNAFGAMIRSEWMTKVRDNNVESIVQLR